MDLTISSKKIGNPLLVELLRKLTVSFSRMHREFYVIGATARDIILKQVVGSESKRRTMDLDIAIAIPNWETFAEVQDVLVADGFEKSRDFKQRFYYRQGSRKRRRSRQRLCRRPRPRERRWWSLPSSPVPSGTRS